jgi:hypothetical protein
MFYPIRLLTEGPTHKAAQARAFSYADQLVERGEFEYYDTDSARTYKLASKLGQEAVTAALARNREEFELAIQVVRLMLRDFTNDQIYQNQFDLPDGSAPGYYASRHQFAIVGGAGNHCYLYGDNGVWGGKIENDRQYDEVIGEKDNLWVTVMSFHN